MPSPVTSGRSAPAQVLRRLHELQHSCQKCCASTNCSRLCVSSIINHNDLINFEDSSSACNLPSNSCCQLHGLSVVNNTARDSYRNGVSSASCSCRCHDRVAVRLCCRTWDCLCVFETAVNRAQCKSPSVEAIGDADNKLLGLITMTLVMYPQPENVAQLGRTFTW